MRRAPLASFLAGAALLGVGTFAALEPASALGAVCVAGAFLLALLGR